MQALIEAGAVPATTYPNTSRYVDTPVVAHDPGTGEPPVPYLSRRLVPLPERLATLGQYEVVEGDRLDLISARWYGDPELWWRIADANPSSHPDELTAKVGRRLRITAPEGMPGVEDHAD
ncbi:LysM peptidoglycan-binding domain-containing protein [Nocardia sp. bgisy134]|uniref:LysM peptidoglycan-binding domain-containing protein n=1 Tax=Nocardia sp. bgisy134 TaxID=3413789 RepID=UPI003D725908